MRLPYRLLNVFTRGDSAFTGNPLAVVHLDGGLLTGEASLSMDDTETMQAIARQFNLSETTFVTVGGPDVEATVRIFTPSYEMPFAGHPTLGTAAVVSDLLGGTDTVRLRMPAGVIPVSRRDDRWVLFPRPATSREPEASAREIASALTLDPSDVVSATWVDSGVEQLVVQVRTSAAVHAAVPDPTLFLRHLRAPYGEAQAYLWSPATSTGTADDRPDGTVLVHARFFFSQDAVVIEDPATGSACANLGGWLSLQGRTDQTLTVHQGDHVARPSELMLGLDERGRVAVGGALRVIGSGTLDW